MSLVNIVVKHLPYHKKAVISQLLLAVEKRKVAFMRLEKPGLPRCKSL